MDTTFTITSSTLDVPPLGARRDGRGCRGRRRVGQRPLSAAHDTAIGALLAAIHLVTGAAVVATAAR
jgi:hypothetical protein